MGEISKISIMDETMIYIIFGILMFLMFFIAIAGDDILEYYRQKRYYKSIPKEWLCKETIKKYRL